MTYAAQKLKLINKSIGNTLSAHKRATTEFQRESLRIALSHLQLAKSEMRRDNDERAVNFNLTQASLYIRDAIQPSRIAA